MIAVEVVVDQAGLLKSCSITGHGAGTPGSDIVCAAVSVLARTAGALLSQAEGITARVEAPERGAFRLEAGYTGGEGKAFLAGAGAFLIEGLRSVAGEFPGRCTMRIYREERS